MSSQHQSRVLTVWIPRPWHEVYERVWRPEAFAEWASGLSTAALTQDGDVWKGTGPEGSITVRFTPHNRYGIMDHQVDLGGGRIVDIPIRMLANGGGAEVQLTLLRQPGMSDAQFAADAEWVERDLKSLAALFA